MTAKKKNKNIPRHKILDKKGRLQAAKFWMSVYNGSNLVSGYSRHFGVDKLCAVRELRLLGVEINDHYVMQLCAALDTQRKIKEERNKMKQFEADFFEEYEEYIFLLE